MGKGFGGGNQSKRERVWQKKTVDERDADDDVKG